MAVTQYIGARYVPLFADPIDWDSTKHYEPLTIVYHQGNSFTSKQFVPTGIDIANGDYWVLTGNYNAQVEQYRREVLEYNGKITANAQAIANEVTARMSEDTAIRGIITDLQGDLSDEVAARTDADTQIRTDFAAADAQIRTDFAAADAQIRTDFAAADAQIRTAFAAADAQIRSDFNKAINAKNNPVTYGADPTGKNDSAAAINQCINACKGETVVFPAGTYRITAPIKTPFKTADRVSIDFNGSRIVYDGDGKYHAAIMIGYSDNPTEEDFNRGSRGNIQSYFSNFSLVNGNCEYAVAINTSYMNSRLTNFYITTARHGIRIADRTDKEPTDVLMQSGFIQGSDYYSETIGVEVNGTDNRFTQLRVYQFKKYFVVNSNSNFFSYIHTLGTDANTKNGISWVVNNGPIWFDHVYNDTVKTAIQILNPNIDVSINSIFDYSGSDIDNRCLVDCSQCDSIPNKIYINNAICDTRNMRYNGVKLHSTSTEFKFANKIDISNVTLSNCDFTDAKLPYDDVIRMGITASVFQHNATGKFYPYLTIITGDIYKNYDLSVLASGRKTEFVIARNATIDSVVKGTVVSGTWPNYTLGFSEYQHTNTNIAGLNSYVVCLNANDTFAFMTEFNSLQECAIIVPVTGNGYNVTSYHPTRNVSYTVDVS